MWVLTGDKIETAINIGYSCKLLSDDMKQFLIDGDNEAIVERQITKVKNWSQDQQSARQALSIVVSGGALATITHNGDLMKEFFRIT